MKDAAQTILSASICALNALILVALIMFYIHINNTVLDREIERLRLSCEKKYPIASLMDTNEGLKITWKEVK